VRIEDALGFLRVGFPLSHEFGIVGGDQQALADRIGYEVSDAVRLCQLEIRGRPAEVANSGITQHGGVHHRGGGGGPRDTPLRGDVSFKLRIA